MTDIWKLIVLVLVATTEAMPSSGRSKRDVDGFSTNGGYQRSSSSSSSSHYSRKGGYQRVDGMGTGMSGMHDMNGLGTGMTGVSSGMTYHTGMSGMNGMSGTNGMNGMSGMRLTETGITGTSGCSRCSLTHDHNHELEEVVGGSTNMGGLNGMHTELQGVNGISWIGVSRPGTVVMQPGYGGVTASGYEMTETEGHHTGGYGGVNGGSGTNILGSGFTGLGANQYPVGGARPVVGGVTRSEYHMEEVSTGSGGVHGVGGSNLMGVNHYPSNGARPLVGGVTRSEYHREVSGVNTGGVTRPGYDIDEISGSSTGSRGVHEVGGTGLGTGMRVVRPVGGGVTRSQYERKEIKRVSTGTEGAPIESGSSLTETEVVKKGGRRPGGSVVRPGSGSLTRSEYELREVSGGSAGNRGDIPEEDVPSTFETGVGPGRRVVRPGVAGLTRTGGRVEEVSEVSTGTGGLHGGLEGSNTIRTGSRGVTRTQYERKEIRTTSSGTGGVHGLDGFSEVDIEVPEQEIIRPQAGGLTSSGSRVHEVSEFDTDIDGVHGSDRTNPVGTGSGGVTRSQYERKEFKRVSTGSEGSRGVGITNVLEPGVTGQGMNRPNVRVVRPGVEGVSRTEYEIQETSGIERGHGVGGPRATGTSVEPGMRVVLPGLRGFTRTGSRTEQISEGVSGYGSMHDASGSSLVGTGSGTRVVRPVAGGLTREYELQQVSGLNAGTGEEHEFVEPGLITPGRGGVSRTQYERREFKTVSSGTGGSHGLGGSDVLDTEMTGTGIHRPGYGGMTRSHFEVQESEGVSGGFGGLHSGSSVMGTGVSGVGTMQHGMRGMTTSGSHVQEIEGFSTGMEGMHGMSGMGMTGLSGFGSTSLGGMSFPQTGGTKGYTKTSSSSYSNINGVENREGETVLQIHDNGTTRTYRTKH